MKNMLIVLAALLSLAAQPAEAYEINVAASTFRRRRRMAT
jgi:hypothetical protein